MAVRPIFIPQSEVIGVDEKMLEFKWHAGFAPTQKQKSITELHKTANAVGIHKVLEISSKSEDELGINLSAFNLLIKTKKNGSEFTVETAFQGSKVFAHGGPYKDLFGLDSLRAKKDQRLKESGNLVAFQFFGKEFPLVPRTFFYDWLYINALVQNEHLTAAIKNFDGFSDIEFNPKKSINCQAHAVALYVSLVSHNSVDLALQSPDDFLACVMKHYNKQDRNIGVQSSLI